MKLRLFLFLFILLINCILNAQVIIYKMRNNENLLLFELIFDQENDITQWKMAVDSKNVTVNESNTSNFFFKKGEKYFFNEKSIKRKFVVDDEPVFNWDLLEEKKVVLGYECKSALCEFRGRKYKIYYTDSLKIKGGPWKFHGINGTILLAESIDGKYSFEAVDLNMNAYIPLKDKFLKIQNLDYISWEDFTKRYEDDLNKFLSEEFCNCPTAGKNILKITKIEKIIPKLHDTGINY